MPLVLRKIQHELRVRLLTFIVEKAPVVKQVRAKAGAGDLLQNCLGMIASVSTFAASSGTTRPVCWVNFSAMMVSLLQITDIGEMAGNGCRRGHCRAHQVRASAAALTAFKVTVAG